MAEREIRGKNVVITGGAMGIGAALADGFLKEGAKCVALWDISEAKGLELESKLNSTYGANTAWFLRCDVTNEEQLTEAYKAAVEKLGRIDVVINNAGILDEHKHQKMIQINIGGLVSSSYKALELMRVDGAGGGAGGTIINVCSIASLMIVHVMPVYCATKSAALAFSNSIGLPERYKTTNVRVLAICYGATDSGILDLFHERQYDQQLARETQHEVAQHPLQSVKSAVDGAVEMFQRGDSGSTWLCQGDQPIRDISKNITKGRNTFMDV